MHINLLPMPRPTAFLPLHNGEHAAVFACNDGLSFARRRLPSSKASSFTGHIASVSYRLSVAWAEETAAPEISPHSPNARNLEALRSVGMHEPTSERIVVRSNLLLGNRNDVQYMWRTHGSVNSRCLYNTSLPIVQPEPPAKRRSSQA